MRFSVVALCIIGGMSTSELFKADEPLMGIALFMIVIITAIESVKRDA